MISQDAIPKLKLREEFQRLAPCPECQRSDNLTTTIENAGAGEQFYVECQACESAVGPRASSYREAFEHWNRFAFRGNLRRSVETAGDSRRIGATR